MVKLRRGFKSECESYACEFREEVGLSPDSALSGSDLAAILDISVHALSSFDGIPDDVKLRFMTPKHCDEFSATVIRLGGRASIIHNDYHSIARQNSNVMHEVAHIVLRHPPTSPLNGGELRTYDSLVESEAKELSFALLVPRAAALAAVERFSSLSEAAQYFGVSLALLNYRVRITDAQGWARNRLRRRI